MSQPDTSVLEAAEIARIRAEYDRRSREMQDDYYGWHRSANYLAHTAASRALIAALLRAGAYPLAGRVVADVGCGDGLWLLEFVQWGADPGDLHAIDLDPRRVEQSRARLPEARISVGDARMLPWRAASIDIAAQFTLFTSILSPAVKRRAAGELLRVLKPGGFILWYDFRVDNPFNPHVRGISAREIRELFPGCSIRLEKTTLAPPLARLVAPRSWTLATALEGIPFLKTHYAGIIRKKSC